MKIKVFKFEVSNSSCIAFSDDKEKEWYHKKQAKLKSPSDIEDEINGFCEGKDIVDIKVQNVDMDYHNNGRSNTIELWYTIMYK